MSALRLPQHLAEPAHVDSGEANLKFELLEEIDAAVEAVWRLVVQHEACDCTDHRELVARYRIPAEVMARIGSSALAR